MKHLMVTFIGVAITLAALTSQLAVADPGATVSANAQQPAAQQETILAIRLAKAKEIFFSGKFCCRAPQRRRSTTSVSI